MARGVWTQLRCIVSWNVINIERNYVNESTRNTIKIINSIIRNVINWMNGIKLFTSFYSNTFNLYFIFHMRYIMYVLFLYKNWNK